MTLLNLGTTPVKKTIHLLLGMIQQKKMIHLQLGMIHLDTDFIKTNLIIINQMKHHKKEPTPTELFQQIRIEALEKENARLMRLIELATCEVEFTGSEKLFEV